MNDSIQRRNSSKNSIHGTAGISTYLVYHINYERRIFSFPDNAVNSINLMIGYGNFLSLNGSGDMVLISSNFIMARSKHHFEIDAGIDYRFNMQAFIPGESVWPLFNLGYRYQKDKGGLLFRTGIGWPDGLFLGLGFTF
ncbi:MAG TPA: hypothetical protein VI583_11960 [Cyclobacteriaceae bacterium]|nr:hypothetical protein [Cyclobacteriaceae bacterium]